MPTVCTPQVFVQFEFEHGLWYILCEPRYLLVGMPTVCTPQVFVQFEFEHGLWYILCEPRCVKM